MSEEYLWDKSGPSDPEVEQLEGVLSLLGEPGPLREYCLPSPPGVATGMRILALLCSLLVITAVVWFVSRPSRPEWIVAPLSGLPRVDSQNLTKRLKLRLGEGVETDGKSSARISFGRLASLEIAPNTSMRLGRSDNSEYRLSLLRGKVNAAVLAPPSLFFLQTPSAVAEDLGCTYSVEVDQAGASIVHVSHGMLSVQSHGLRSYILAGATCVSRKNSAPDTPYFCDASPSLIAALKEFDKKFDPRALRTVLANARPKDALSLWHLIPKTSGVDTKAVVDQLADFVRFPPGVTRDGVTQQNKAMLGQWWATISAEITQP